MRPLRFDIIAASVLLAGIAWDVGCNPQPGKNSPTGQGLARIQSDGDSARKTADQIKPHADAVGQALVENQKSDLDDLLLTVTQTQKDFADSERYKKALEDTNGKLQEQIVALDHSWGHKLQVGVTWAFWIIVGLIAVHLVTGAIGFFFAATPWGKIVGLISKLVNPLGWGTWLVSYATKKAAVNSAVKTAAPMAGVSVATMASAVANKVVAA